VWEARVNAIVPAACSRRVGASAIANFRFQIAKRKLQIADQT
jgi:hypothetical protein